MYKGTQHHDSCPVDTLLKLCYQQHDLLLQCIAKPYLLREWVLDQLSMVDLQLMTSGSDGCQDILIIDTLQPGRVAIDISRTIILSATMDAIGQAMTQADYDVGSFTDVDTQWGERLWALLNEPESVRSMMHA